MRPFYQKKFVAIPALLCHFFLTSFFCSKNTKGAYVFLKERVFILFNLVVKVALRKKKRGQMLESEK